MQKLDSQVLMLTDFQLDSLDIVFLQLIIPLMEHCICNQ